MINLCRFSESAIVCTACNLKTHLELWLLLDMAGRPVAGLFLAPVT
jgi:hypothetical protein